MGSLNRPFPNRCSHLHCDAYDHHHGGHDGHGDHGVSHASYACGVPSGGHDDRHGRGGRCRSRPLHGPSPPPPSPGLSPSGDVFKSLFLHFAVPVFTSCIICIICITGHLYHCFDTAPHLPNCLGLGQPHPLPAKKRGFEEEQFCQKRIFGQPQPLPEKKL